MTITYPRDFPDADIKASHVRFDYAPLGQLSRSAAGAITFQESMGGSLWELAMTTKPLNETDYGMWHAWFLSLRGGAQSFKGRDPRRCWPIVYGPGVLNLTRAGGGAFDGTCNVTAVGGSTVSLGNLPANYAMGAGDYISFPWFGGQVLVKSLEAIVGAAGGTLTVTIGPWLRSGGSLPATATLVKAWCLMRPKPGSWQGDRTVRDAISFEAIQTLL